MNEQSQSLDQYSLLFDLKWIQENWIKSIVKLSGVQKLFSHAHPFQYSQSHAHMDKDHEGLSSLRVVI